MRIPLGNFGNVVAQPQQQAQVPGSDGIGQAVSRAGAVGTQIANQLMQEQAEMARIKASNAFLDHQIFVKNQTQDISDRIARGELPYRDAPKVFKEEIGSQPMPEVDGMQPAEHENLLRGIRRNIAGAEFTISRVVEGAQRADFKGQFGAALDKLGKLAATPDADIEKINQQAELLTPLAKKAGIQENVFGKTLQDFKDKNWTNDATQRAMQSKDDLDQIQQLEHDLTASDGFYANKLDTDKRNLVLRGVINDRIRIENRQQHDVDRREAKAEKTLEEVDRQIASGIPMKPEDALTWSEKVKGTSSEAGFQQRIQEEMQVQQVLRLPIDQQKTFVQQKESDLMNGGGTVRDKANVGRLKSAVDQNIKQLQNAPLLFAQNRTGQAVKPLDIPSLLDPNGGAKLIEQMGEQMGERVATVGALQKQYGPQVKMHPLLPQEAEVLVKVLGEATPKQQAALFSVLRTSFNDDAAYTSTMQQIAPDSPVKALAGAIYAKQRGITLERKWYGTESVASSTDVAETLLVGDSIVNKSRAQKAEDGMGKSMYLPPLNAFKTSFESVASDLYRGGRSAAQETDLQAAYTYYVGRASQIGRLTSSATDIDSGLVKEALAATVGEPINFNQHGMITAPWGMSKESFKRNISASFEKTIEEHGIPKSEAYQFESYGLMHYRGGTYVPTLGGLPMVDPKTGKPLMLDVGDTPINPGLKVPQ
jgi:hypothetical protein